MIMTKLLDFEIFASFQIDVVKSTWPILSKDLLGTGTILFKNIFAAEPDLLTLFRFK